MTQRPLTTGHQNPTRSRSLALKLWLTTGLLSATSLLAPALCLRGQTQTDRVRSLLDRGEFAQAKAILESIPGSGQTAELSFLRGKVRYLWGDINGAVDLFEKAAEAGPSKSEYFLWLGRAFGRKAEKAMFLKAPSLAGKSRDAFQRAVELDPNDLDARDDLLSFYLEAPGFLGGGKEKALALVEQIKSSHPCEFHRQRAEIYQKEKSFDRAEQELQKATEVEPSCLGGYRALAELFERRGRMSQARETLEKTVQLFAKSPVAHFALGRFEAEVGGKLETARRELELFLKTYISGEPYPFEGHYWLGEVFLKLKQPERAQEQFQQALRAYPVHSPSLKGGAEARRLLSSSGR
jgi:tetratricopeptide (TPR) repeat protein